MEYTLLLINPLINPWSKISLLQSVYFLYTDEYCMRKVVAPI